MRLVLIVIWFHKGTAFEFVLVYSPWNFLTAYLNTDNLY